MANTKRKNTSELIPPHEDNIIWLRSALIALALITVSGLIGTGILGSNAEDYGLLRALVGIITALSLLGGSILVVYGVHRTPRTAMIGIVFASSMIVISELLRVIAALSGAPVHAFDKWINLCLYVGAMTFVGFMNLALFEIAVQTRRAQRESARSVRAEYERLRTEGRYHVLFDNASDGIAVISRNGNIVAANYALRNLLAYDGEEMSNKPFEAHVHETSKEALQKSLRHLGEGNKTGLLEVTLLRKDASGQDVELSVSRLPDSETLVLVRDITARKEIENRVQRIQRMESIGRLAGGIAHDFNNVLTPIIGYAEMLLNQFKDDPAFATELEAIVKAGEHARDLTQQLLAFGRKQTLKVRIIDLNTIVTSFQNVLKRVLRENVIIELRLAPTISHIKADTSQIEQVLMNLSINAHEAMPDGGTLSIETKNIELDDEYARLHPEATAGSYVMLSVSDTGIGMDKELLKHVFEPLFSTKKTGSGFGLATVYGIVQQHGGAIGIYSEPNVGTTCRVYFPQTTDEPVSTIPIASPANMVPTGKTIVVVEDEDAVRVLVVRMLQKNGYTTLQAENAQACLALLETHTGTIDLLLTDVIMPGLNGKQLYEKVCERFPGIRVLYMSGYSDAIISKNGLIEDSTAFIPKPLSMKSLTEKIREVLQ